MYRNFYSVNDMPQAVRQSPPIQHKNEEQKNCSASSDIIKHENNSAPLKLTENGKFLGKFELDDIILIVVALLLIADNCDDTLLLLAIGFVFLSGIL